MMAAVAYNRRSSRVIESVQILNVHCHS